MPRRTSSDTSLFFNGINGVTGRYGLPPISAEKSSALIRHQTVPENLRELKLREQQCGYELRERVDPKKLDEAGWGIIFASNASPGLKEALTPLLNLRQTQCGERFRCYEGGQGYRVDADTKSSFLARHGAGPGPADPNHVPYYLLIVGGPDIIPFRFQSQLDIQYAVGRIDFSDVESYANYARSVVDAETVAPKLDRRIAFFGVTNPDDRATKASTRRLVMPLLDTFKSEGGWEVIARLNGDATKAQLDDTLNAGRLPALLFTASHGMEFPAGHKNQISHQGALLCADWPGPNAWKAAIPQEFYFASDDVASDARLLGLISIHFACYGAGTPELDEFSKLGRQPKRIAPHPFLAALPTRLLSLARGGALAVIGHVERCWGYSFNWPGAGAQTAVFESALQRLLDGHPVGSALDHFNFRYAELASMLSDRLEFDGDPGPGYHSDPYELAALWTASNDARGYVVIGDPAVRLCVTAANTTGPNRQVDVASAARREFATSSTTLLSFAPSSLQTSNRSWPTSSWDDPADGENRLSEALNSFDWSTADRITDELIQTLPSRNDLDVVFAKRILTGLRRKRRFAAMTRLADAFLAARLDSPVVRLQYAQSLIDQGIYHAAQTVLARVRSDDSIQPFERAETEGLLGRVSKQLFVSQIAAISEIRRQHLENALDAYGNCYHADPRKYVWQGINVAALLARAARNSIVTISRASDTDIATDILNTLSARERDSESGDLDAWGLATSMESCLALGQFQRAVKFAARYVWSPGADAFEIASTLRQLEEIWELSDSTPPGDELLPILRAALLRKEGGAVFLSAKAANMNLEKVFGSDNSVNLQWYQQGLERARSIARIELNGKGFGTAWLIDSKPFFPMSRSSRLLITNAHVIAPDTPDRYQGALRPQDVQIHFQLQEVKLAAGHVLFHSPVTELDAVLLEVPGLPDDLPPLPVDFGAVILDPPPRLYIIGHPSGREIEFALQDNFLLAANERLIHYRTPTEGGSSGSPVFGPVDWNVIGLHHAGRRDMPRLDRPSATYEANEGILLSALRKRLG